MKECFSVLSKVLLISLFIFSTANGEEMSLLNNENNNESLLVKQCDDLWGQMHGKLINDPSISYKELLADWQNIDSKYKALDSYYYHLATIYLALNDIEPAEENLRNAIEIKQGYLQLAELALLHVELKKLMIFDVVDRSRYLTLHNKYLEVLEKNSESGNAYEQIAILENLLEMHSEAIEHSIKAIELKENSWASYRNLVISYTNLGEFKKAVDAVEKAYAINKRLYYDIDFMLASAASFAAIGQDDVSMNILNKLLELQPKVDTSEDFHRTIEFINKQIDMRAE
ncbi:MAG: hypothetical protein D6B28_03765 [Gammaproteobacteria bacterium]|nr:MAG: hypothetical protein D6B28_03765 [Gammaproteobacteria bacterium]